MNPRILISCQNLGYSSLSTPGISTEGKWDIREFNLELHAGEKACFHFQNEDQRQVLWRLFQKKLKPKTGSLHISANTHLHTDESLWECTNKKATVKVNMESKLFMPRPWFGGKRENLDILKDRLGLTGSIINIPVNKLQPEYAARFWALMLVSANTKVVLMNRIISELDTISLPFVQEWQESFSGITIIFGEHHEYLKAVKFRKKIQNKTLKSFFSTKISFSASGLAKHF